ncbi:MAG: hypothetical protein IKN10_06660 [Muribaculaceae bacterium]|nr:hypothetical protein [Muribaculaceae bacterium]
MKRTILILLAMLTLTPAALRAQETESLYTGWGAGFHIGVGGMVPTGSLDDDLKGCAVFTGGFDLEYQRARLKIDVNYSQPSFKNENPYAIYDENGRNLQMNGSANTTNLGAGFQLGYTVWRQGKVSVTPCVGINFSRLRWDMNTIKWEKDDEGEERPKIDNVTDVHENSTGWTASVDIDIMLGGKFVDLGGKSHYVSSVRITPFITHAGYSHLSPAVKGNWIGMTVSYAGLSRLLSSR